MANKTMAAILSELQDRLEPISDARDEFAETGKYPPFPDGPGDDQGFDDWAADQADEALKLLMDLQLVLWKKWRPLGRTRQTE